MLLAHATAWHIYDKEFRSKQQGRITIVLNTQYFDPKTDSEADKAASNRGIEWYFGWMAHPVFKSDYPQIMKDSIAEKSRQKGLPCRWEFEVTTLNKPVRSLKQTALITHGILSVIFWFFCFPWYKRLPGICDSIACDLKWFLNSFPYQCFM